MDQEDKKKTIIAVASGAGPSAICVIRISGDLSFPFLKSHVEKVQSSPRRVFLAKFIESGQCIDQIVYIFYQGPRSYTGEDMVEIYAHGSPLIGKEIVSCGIRWGLHPAMPGEFTKRAVKNKKFSAEQAESLGVLLTTSNKSLYKRSLQFLCGDVDNGIIQKLKELLQKGLATTEASLEFGERDVLELSDTEEIQSQLQEIIFSVKNQVELIVNKFRQEQKKDSGIVTILVGRPNAGKSSLMNALLEKNRMIISETPGTTRDFVQENLIVENICFKLIDTAGIRDSTSDEIERIGIENTEKILLTADLICYVATDSLDIPILQKIQKVYSDCKLLVLLNKRDALLQEEIQKIQESFSNLKFPIKQTISTFINEDIQKLKEFLKNMFYCSQESFSTLQIVSERQAVVLEKILNMLDDLYLMVREREELVIVSQKIQEVLSFWGEFSIEGAKKDSILEAVFSAFCVGK